MERQADWFSFGAGGQTMVILPGLGTRSILFSEMMITSAYRRFGERYTVYVFDRRTDLPEGYTVREMARDVAALMRRLGLRDADVFGASLGGMIAQCLAIDAPELVHAAVFGSTAPRANPHLLRVAEEWAEAADSGNLDALTQSFLCRLYSADTVARYGNLLSRMNDGLTQEELRRFAVQARAIRGFDITAELPKMRCPALVIGVEGDRVVTAEASEELASLLGCGCFLYPDAYGHCVFDEAPDYKDRLLRFFESIK